MRRGPLPFTGSECGRVLSEEKEISRKYDHALNLALSHASTIVFPRDQACSSFRRLGRKALAKKLNFCPMSLKVSLY